MKAKKPSLAKAKAKAWSAFSIYIRTKGATGNMNTCITCGRIKDIKKLQAGHFIPGRHNAILFDENGVHPQCYACNVVLGGNGPIYYQWMMKHYGLVTINRLMKLSNTQVKYTVEDYIFLENKYKDKLQQLTNSA